MKIPINVPAVGREEVDEVRSVLLEKSLTTAANAGGKRVQEFEKLLSSYTGSRYAIAVNSGTAALQAALYALDIKSGDEVLIPSFTFVATANAVVSVGAKPVFVDILSSNYTMSPDDLRKKITRKSRAIIPVHLYGNFAHMKEITEIAGRHGLDVVEDAAQSLGTSYRKKQSGTFSRMGCFSMYAAKVVTAGEGGAIVTDEKGLMEKLRKIRNHGMLHGYDTRILGLNLRLPEISAAVAKVQMKKLPMLLKKRERNAKVLTELLGGLNITLPTERTGVKVNWYLYTISAKNRDRLAKLLNSKGIGATAYYATPAHKTPFYSSKSSLPITDWAASTVLSLPVHPLVTEDNLHFIAKAVRQALER